VAIKKFKHLHHRRKTILSWSLNSEAVVRNEERGTAALISRFKAAKACESWGYPLAFHFDPLVLYDGWEADYRRSVQQLFAHVAAQNVAWISLGALRFMPGLKPIIQRRFPESKIVYGELISGLDGKLRYLKRLRIDLYRKMVGWIKDIAPDVLIYFCMEDDEVWQKTLGFAPAERGGLGRMLDQSAIRLCQLKSD
jgi:spore photoproduct lyase